MAVKTYNNKLLKFELYMLRLSVLVE